MKPTLDLSPHDNSESNEITRPGQKLAPRVPGLKRDYGKLPVNLRSEKGPQPNLVLNDRDTPVEGIAGKSDFPSIKVEATPRNERQLVIARMKADQSKRHAPPVH